MVFHGIMVSAMRRIIPPTCRTAISLQQSNSWFSVDYQPFFLSYYFDFPASTRVASYPYHYQSWLQTSINSHSASKYHLSTRSPGMQTLFLYIMESPIVSTLFLVRCRTIPSRLSRLFPAKNWLRLNHISVSGQANSRTQSKSRPCFKSSSWYLRLSSPAHSLLFYTRPPLPGLPFLVNTLARLPFLQNITNLKT